MPHNVALSQRRNRQFNEAKNGSEIPISDLTIGTVIYLKVEPETIVDLKPEDIEKCEGVEIMPLQFDNIKSEESLFENSYAQLNLVEQAENNLIQNKNPMLWSLSEDVEGLVCSICSRHFEVQFDLHNHMLTHYEEKLRSEVDQSSDDQSKKKFLNECSCPLCEAPFSKLTSKKREHVCLVCQAKFDFRSDFVKHMRKHPEERPFTCDICAKNFFSKSELREHIATHLPERPFVCSTCNATFVIRRTLKMHMKTHSQEKPYVCNVCDKNFLTSTYLKLHMQSHSEEKRYVCTQCDKKFARSAYLRRHINKHTGEKPHVCSICDKRFPTKWDRDTHENKHKGIKEFGCDACRVKFLEKKSLKRHIQRQKVGKCHQCPKCDKQFFCLVAMQRHLVSHDPRKAVVCPACEAKFSTKAILKKHFLSKHTCDNDPILCYLCNESFFNTIELEVHVRRHIPNEYSCNICDAKFTLFQLWKIHMRRHKEEKERS